MRKRLLSIFLTVAMILGLCSPAGRLIPTAEAAVSGSLVELGAQNIRWTRDENRVLTLMGTGAIPDEPTKAGVCPFHDPNNLDDLMYRLTKIIIGEGITHIGAEFFSDARECTEVSLPSTLVSIGKYAFEDACSLTSITIPRSVTTIETGAFSGCSELCDIYYEGTEAEWKQIEIGSYNGALTGANLHCSSGGESEAVQIPTPVLKDIENKTAGIRITWDADFYLPGIDVSTLGYHVLRKTDGGSYEKIATLTDLSTNSYTDSNVEMLKEYTYTVRIFAGNRAGDYDSKGLTITRLAEVTESYDASYPNPDLGWPVVNSNIGFDLDEDYRIPRNSYYEVLGTDISDVLTTELRHIFKWGGYCYGMSLLAAAQYNGQISLETYFPRASGDSLADFGFTDTTMYGGMGYVAQITDSDIIQFVERAHLLQYTEELQAVRIYNDEEYPLAVFNCIDDLVSYLLTDNSKPLLITLSSAGFGHAVLTYPDREPEDQGNGCYAIPIYDPNTPQVGNNILSTYLSEGTLHPFYKPGCPYLVLDTENDSWAYYNFYNGKDSVSSAYYWPQKTLECYDVSKLSSRVFTKTGVNRTGNFLMLSPEQLDTADTISVIMDWDGESTPVLSITKDKIEYNPSIVKNYTWSADQNSSLFVWLEDDCNNITIQGDGFESLYCAGDTLYSASVTGAASVSFANGLTTVETDDGGNAFVGIERNARTENGGPAVSSETTLSAGEEFTLELSKDGTPSISGPDNQKYDVVIEKDGVCTEKNNVTEDELAAPAVGAFPFTDVTTKDWFYDAVKYVYENSLMSGTSATTFTPNGTMSRAMLATVLYRMEGEPAVDYTVGQVTHGGYEPWEERPEDYCYCGDFLDVAPDMWYSDAIMWANQEGIVSGYDEDTFGTNDAVTREQLVTMLFRYAQTKTNSFIFQRYSNYKDANQVSDWASKAMMWAMGHDIISGTSNTTLSPKNTATRAQCATILMRFLEE